MTLKQSPELHAFLSTHFADADAEHDDDTARKFAEATPLERRALVAAQARAAAADPTLSTEELGMEANRWFGDAAEARAWLERIAGLVEGAAGGGGGSSLVVKDSNGTALAEGDAVTVIKDLKVKGGSSDLKRGTLIKKIHLVEDTEVVECRVDGSTLVLKTCFLKKA